MLEQKLQSIYPVTFVDPIAHKIKHLIKPNTLTLLGGLIGLFTVPALAYGHSYFALLCLLSSGYLDTLDGAVARASNQLSEWGSLLDIMMDRTVEFAVILGLWLMNPTSRSLLCIMMLGSILLCVTSFLLVGLFTKNQSHKSFHYSPGLIERAEAFIFFSLMMLLPSYFNFFAVIFTTLVLLTTLIRMNEFYRALHHQTH